MATKAKADRPAIEAEGVTDEELAEEVLERALIEAEFPPAKPGPEWAEGLARLRLAREARGLSLDDVAERTGMDRMVVSRIERAIGNPTINSIGRLAMAVGVRAVLTFEDAG